MPEYVQLFLKEMPMEESKDVPTTRRVSFYETVTASSRRESFILTQQFVQDQISQAEKHANTAAMPKAMSLETDDDEMIVALRKELKATKMALNSSEESN